MPSTVHALIKSEYKTFQANPGMPTPPTPRNIGTSQGQFQPTESPAEKSPVYTSYLSSLRPAGKRPGAHRQSPEHTMHHSKAEPECPTPISEVIWSAVRTKEGSRGCWKKKTRSLQLQPPPPPHTKSQMEAPLTEEKKVQAPVSMI